MLKECYHQVRRFTQWIGHREVYRQLQDFTMIPENLFLANMELAEHVRNLPGCVVECGVWKGGMSAGIASVLGADRHYYLLDSFEGLPAAREIDGAAAIEWQSATSAENYFDNCSAPKACAEQAMKLVGASSFSLVQGWFAETLPTFSPEQPIALLRLDGDWYDSTMTCLEHLFDRLTPGALVIIDDYGTWDGCTRAVHDFLSKRSAVERLREHAGVSYFVKRSISA